ncbi:mediator of RNA polymerase II transcription subunit 13 isoform X3 [Physcomitrium patens]|uniref:mediator of RNA polymerase II transcription subunit 13 isoform X3 n=1 Tax=Physcomitrium patens TaxID=3218 RepID=UPI000D17D7FF|nr:mediator of RNA polymerase II transcription subunit 13-like isoform X3 [Physcomitrium patens]|eukprot:XP_024380105.1 mediator of RNA polymerase II transcription subunit 13-like isoform X3 [Physcomitrella patens]
MLIRVLYIAPCCHCCSKLQAYDASSLPFRVVGSTSAVGTSPVQQCYAEVTLDEFSGNTITNRSSAPGVANTKMHGKSRNAGDRGHVLVYPLDAVLAPMRPLVPTQPLTRRCWFQEWAGTTWLEDWTKEEILPSNRKNGLDDGESREKSSITGIGVNGSVPGHSNGPGMSSNSSGGRSSDSSQGSSDTSSSSDVDGDGLGEIEADGDSLGSKGVGALISKNSDMHIPSTSSQGLDMDIGDMKNSHGAYSQCTKRGRQVKSIAAFDPPSKALKRSSSIGNDVLSLMDGTNSDKKGTSFLGESSGLGGGIIGGGSQLGNPWDQWDNNDTFDMGLGMDIQSDADILAEFRDFGDFFEDDGLGFGEPPDTAESQALMFSLPDYGEVSQTPGTAPLDVSDPLVLPILDFPMLGMDQNTGDLLSDIKPTSSMEVSQAPIEGPSSPSRHSPELNLRLKSEAMLCFASGFEPVDMASVPDVGVSTLRDPYVPASKRNAPKSVQKDLYQYSAAPISYAKPERSDVGKDEQRSTKSPNESGESKRKELTADYIVVSGAHGSKHLNGKLLTSVDEGPDRAAGTTLESNKQSADTSGGGKGPQIPGDPFSAQFPSTVKLKESTKSSIRSPVAVLATELECALLQVMKCLTEDSPPSVSGNSVAASPGIEAARSFPLPSKDGGSDITQVQFDLLAQSASGLPKTQRERQKKVPERIAGFADGDMHDGGSRIAQVGVWRPVGVSKPLRSTNTSRYANSVDFPSRVSNSTSTVDLDMDDVTASGESQRQWRELLEAVPMLAQQASIAVDVSLDGRYGDGPFGWLAAQEVQRQQRKSSADCSQEGGGGMLSFTRCLDQSGMEILDPLSDQISAATASNLLQSDMRVAMANAFGDGAADGPLALVDWCKGFVQSSDGGLCAESTNTEVNSIVTVVGESMTPSQSGGGLKGADIDDIRRNSSSSRAIDSSSLSDQTDPSQRRGLSDDSAVSHADAFGYNETSILALPTPSLLVGYQEDWLKTSCSALHLWEKAPLEPYALAKQVNYHVICLASEPLVTAAADFFQQLSSVYEICRLGSHLPSGTAAGPTGSVGSFSKQSLSGFTLVDVPGVSHSGARGEFHNASNYSLAKAFMGDMAANWNMAEYRKALRKVCKALPLSSGSSANQRELELGPSTVVYVVCPVSDPAGILQTMVDACASLGSAITGADSQRHAPSTSGEDTMPPSLLGFSNPRFCLQLITAETIFKSSGPQASCVDVLKEVAMGVYNKVRRIPRHSQKAEYLQNSGASDARGQFGNTVNPSGLQSNTPMPGLWKDCSGQRGSGHATIATLNSSKNHNIWDGGWKSSTQTDIGTAINQVTDENVRYLYEPAYILARSGAQASAVAFCSDAIRDAVAGCNPRATGNASSGSDVDSTAITERMDADANGVAEQAADLYCCYTWSVDWNWLVSVWTDARGELLDTQLLSLTGIDTTRENCLQILFHQILQQGLQLLNLAVEAGSCRSRGLNITRLGGFYAKESHEWHRVIMAAGADEVRKWPVQIGHPDCHTSSCVGGARSLSDMGLMSDRGLGLGGSGPTSPIPSSSSFGGREKTSHSSKPGVDMSSGLNRRQNQASNQMGPTESTMEMFKWVHSVSLVSVRVDQSLQILSTTEGPAEGTSSSGPSWPAGSGSVLSGVVSVGVNTVKTLAWTGASYSIVPSHVNRPLSTSSVELLLKCPHTEQSPLAQLLQSTGLACPVSTAYTVSAGTSSTINDFAQRSKEDWPSTMSMGLVAHYGTSTTAQDSSGVATSSKGVKPAVVESKEQALEVQRILQTVASDLHALSWLNVGVTCVQRRSPLPFHCEVAQRTQRLLDFLDAEFGYGSTTIS